MPFVLVELLMWGGGYRAGLRLDLCFAVNGCIGLLRLQFSIWTNSQMFFWGDSDGLEVQ